MTIYHFVGIKDGDERACTVLHDMGLTVKVG